MADYTGLTDEQIAAEKAAMDAEIVKRNQVRNLEDRVMTAIMDAKNAGYTKAQITASLTKMMGVAFPN